MTSSTNIQRGLDTPVLVYSLLQGHPASMACEQFIRAHGGWFSTVPALLEAKVVLTKSYGVAPADASQRLAQFEWLNQSYGQAAQDFWSQTGGANHLP